MRSGYVQYESVGKSNVNIIIIGLLVGVAFGGAGVSYPALSAITQAIAIAALCWLLPRIAEVKIVAITRLALLVLLAIVLLPIAQLIPLPWSAWTDLPGRQLATAIRTQAGLAGSANPLSLRPEATLEALLALLPPAAAFLAVLFLDDRGRMAVLRALVALAVLNAMLGALQLAYGGTGVFALFESTHRGDALGLFVNHSHSATFLLIGLVAASVPRLFDGGGRPGGQWPVALGVIALLALAVVGTRSRTGLLTLLPVLLFSAYLRFPRAWNVKWLLVAVFLLGAIVFAVGQTPLAQTTLARFSVVDQDSRQIFWTNTLYAIAQFFPWGSGLGTFTTIYPSIEPLDQVRAPIVNHAHNDYLELALEAGLPALILMAAALALAAAALVRALPRPGLKSWQSRSLTLAAGAIVTIILLHSLDDYPLRMPAVAISFAACLAMLFPRARGGRVAPVRGIGFWLRRALVLGAGLALGWQVVSVSMASHLLLHDQPVQAVQWRPASAEAWARVATKRAVAADWSGSAAAAKTALELAPMNAAAVRALGLAEAAAGRWDDAGRLLLLGGQLGWRDVPTQLWLIQRSLELGDPVVAVQRADGLLRQDQQTGLLFGQLRHLLGDAVARAAVAKTLAQRPPWRHAFLVSFAGDGQVRGEDVADLYRQLAAEGGATDTAESAPLLDRLWRAGRYSDVRAVWRAAGGAGLVVDGGFERSASDLRGIGPFTWQAAGLLGTRVGIETPEPAWQGKALSVESRGMAAGPAARQRLVLAPGPYVLRFALKDSGSALTRPSWVIACAPGFAAPSPPPPTTWSAAEHGWLRGEVRLEVGADCPGQELQLILHPAQGLRSVLVDDVELVSASNG
jgi:O-antigen ligase